MDRGRSLRLGASLKLDAVGAEVARALSAASMEVVFIKGAALAERLYADAGFRPYDDVDVLADPATIGRVENVLHELEFERAADGDYADPWIRSSDGATVDLHNTLPGLEIEPADAWAELARHTREGKLAGAPVLTLDDVGLALVTALHAAHHGPAGGKALEDLRRALDQLPEETWREAAALAARLRGTAAFAAALRLLPAGRERAERLALPHDLTTEVALGLSSPPPVAPGLLRLLRAEGWRERGALLLHEVAPPPAFMRATSKLARRGGVGLAASYAWRPVWLVLRLPAAARAVRRARR